MSSPTDPRTRSAWPMVVIASIGAVVAGTMAIMHVSTDVIVVVMSLLVVPVISTYQASTAGETNGRVASVQTATNGNMSLALQILQEQSRLLAASAPTGEHPIPPPTPPGPTP